MTTITAKIIADSINESGNRLTTMQLRYPRWIHAEGRTHRQLDIGEELEVELRTPSLMEDDNLSRNASSSRAIPVSRLIQDVLDDPAIPMFWGANQKGMQAGGECNTNIQLRYIGSDFVDYTREQGWLEARNRMIELARAYDAAGYHKQIVNRLLEPFSHINVVVTATEWSNFYALRRHNDAEPHIHFLADRMWSAMEDSTPLRLAPGQWHLPYVSPDEYEYFWLRNEDNLAIKLSVARCASVSYKTVDGLDMTPARAILLHDKLVSGNPLHASPCEHQAHADRNVGNEVNGDQWLHPEWWGNFKGFCQYRKTLPGECL